MSAPLPAATTLLLALLCTPAPAQEPFCGRATPHPIDRELAEASARSGGVTVDLRDAQSAAYAAWDKELNRVYAELLRAAAPADRELLRKAQRAWLAFDQAQADWDASGSRHGNEGTSAALNIADAALQRRRARVCDLEGDLHGLREMAE
ncbi:lysozyme inhibitor LprI family protein [Tahibacter harae]|uniref:DUF1311 domain-containing protein n=1 Tax=Tahibacter harae TaxID=2963937 RepID=A0ABT1QM34_9GAMM|nr:lysozyme inhibitor LprI family protein [Tahibacter harae]MCQ4163583.1 DUF1311 domain-containing protein [Tahibacter harae]